MRETPPERETTSMAAFFRGLLVFLFGAIVGAGGILFFTPSFNVVVSRSESVAKPIEIAVASAPAAIPAVPAAPVAVAASPAVPAKPVMVAEVKPAAPAAPVALAATEPAIDFKSISEHLILWPTSVTVKTATTVPVMADGKKVQDLALDVGTILQVSKVLADGSLEARAKGAKFEIKSTLTDFSAELGKRVSELVAKGVKIDSPFASAAVAMTPVAAPAVTPAPTAPVAVAVDVPKGPLTLAQRVDILFGNKPEEVIPAAPAAPAATTAVVPTAPVVEAAAATPMADPKAAEKGKDLDRKMNQLFK